MKVERPVGLKTRNNVTMTTTSAPIDLDDCFAIPQPVFTTTLPPCPPRTSPSTPSSPTRPT